jgi:molybdate transport system regulatory protein
MKRQRSAVRGFVGIQPRVKVWLEIEGEYVFGHGLSEILKAVDQAGSIKEGAHRLGKSYRYVWSRIKEAEQAIGCSLVETRVGGTGSRRSCLTPEAAELIDSYDSLRRDMFESVARRFQERFGRRAARR